MKILEHEVGDYVKVRSKEWKEFIKSKSTNTEEKRKDSDIYKFYNSRDLKTALPQREAKKLLGKVGKIINLSEENDHTVFEILIKIDQYQKRKVFIDNPNLLSSYLPITMRVYKFCFNRCTLKCSKKCSLY